MSSLLTRGLIAAACVMAAGQACAEVNVSVKKSYYTINGRTGAALLEHMDRSGPKHGFLTRAIAQTRYSVTWKIEWAQEGSTCRVRTATADLDITYTYPKIGGPVSAALDKRWRRFFAGVRKHEEIHGKIARDMVFAAEKMVQGLSTRNDRTCARSKREVKRRVDELYDRYEAKQVAFDKSEHRPGGPVQGLVEALVGRK